VTEERLPEVKVIVYEVPEFPEIPRLVKVATPFTAVAEVVPTSEAPADTVAVTTELESPVAVLPEASLMVMAGCVEKADPAVKPAADVVSASCVDVPAPESVKALVTTLPSPVPAIVSR
jgi:hypothetical protein